MGQDLVRGGPPGWEFVNVENVQIGQWGLEPKDPWPDGYLSVARPPVAISRLRANAEVSDRQEVRPRATRPRGDRPLLDRVRRNAIVVGARRSGGGRVPSLRDRSAFGRARPGILALHGVARVRRRRRP